MQYRIFILTLLILATGAYAITVTTCPNSYYNSNVSTMNASLGLDTSYLFEDFEDDTLLPQLSISYSNGQTTPDFYTYSGMEWDGSRKLVSLGEGRDTTFSFQQGLSFFGIGLSGFYYNHTAHGQTQLYINENYYGLVNQLPNYVDLDGGRNLYLKIAAGVGEVITSIKFIRIDLPNGDWQYFDHMAIKMAPVPEPAIWSMLLIGMMLIYKLKK